MNGAAHRFWQWAAVADAGCAAIANGMKAKRLEMGRQAGLVQVFGDDFGAGRQACFDIRFGTQPARMRFSGQQAGGDHHRGIAGVGAGCNRGDHHRTMLEFDAVAMVT